MSKFSEALAALAAAWDEERATIVSPSVVGSTPQTVDVAASTDKDAARMLLDAPNADVIAQKDYAVISKVVVSGDQVEVSGANFTANGNLQFLFGDDTYDMAPAAVNSDGTQLSATYHFATAGTWRVRVVTARGTPSIEFPLEVTL